MGIKIPNGSGGFKDISALKRYDTATSSWISCSFARVYVSGAWVDKWLNKKVILNPGAWVSGGITGWQSYSTPPGYVVSIQSTQVAGQYTEVRATSSYSGGFSNQIVYAIPTPAPTSGFTKLKVVYGECVPYPGLTYLVVGGTNYSLDSVSNTTVTYNIDGTNLNIGLNMAATSAQARYIRIISMELSS